MRPFAIVPATCLLGALLALTAACSSPEDKVAGHLARAEQLLEDGDYAKAAVEAKNAVQIQPKNAQGHLILAKLAWREQKLGDAFAQLQMALEGDPDLIEARLRLGDLYLSAGDVAAAATQAARQLGPDRADVRLLSGKVLYLQGDVAAAVAEMDKALEVDPAFVDAYTARSTVYTDQKDLAGALALLDKGIAATTGTAAELLRDFRLAVILESGDDAAYEAAARELIAAFPKETRYRYRLVEFCRVLRQPQPPR